MADPRPAWPIRWWLGTFGAAVALPFIVLLAVMFFSQIRAEGREARENALRISRAAAERLVTLRADSITLLRRMAARPAIQNFDREPCDSLFALVDFFPQYANLLLFDANGKLLCSAQPELHDRVVSDAALAWLQNELRNGRVNTGKLTIHQTGELWFSTLTLPVRSATSGAPATLALVALPEIVAREAMPPGSVVTILDRNGTVLARTSEPGTWKGRNTRSNALTQIVLQRHEGTAESIGLDGVRRQYGFTFVPELDCYINVGIPTATLMGPVRALYVRGLEAGVLVVLIAVVMAMMLSRMITRPINDLALIAEAMARSAYHPVILKPRAPREIATLATAFNSMVDTRSRAERQMEEDEQRLKALSERLLVIQEEERTRIARAIHDDLGQALTALKMDILGLLEKSQVPPSPTSERVRRTLDTTVTAVQRIARELRPSMLDDLGLVAALEAEVRLFEERTGIECELSLPDTPLPLSAESSTVLYRIIQEALTNVLRHSNASRVEIRLRQRGDEMFLEIRDDGRGITTQEVNSPASLGLIGIRERAAIIDGSAEVEGVAGKGTIVSVRIPCDAHSRAAS